MPSLRENAQMSRHDGRFIYVTPPMMTQIFHINHSPYCGDNINIFSCTTFMIRRGILGRRAGREIIDL